jgi:hypothetical protein
MAENSKHMITVPMVQDVMISVVELILTFSFSSQSDTFAISSEQKLFVKSSEMNTKIKEYL